MKKWLSLLLSVLMIATMLPMGALTTVAATDEAVSIVSEEPTVEISDATGKPGEIVTVSVSLKNNPGIISAKVLVGYDVSALILKEYAMGDLSVKGYSWGPIENNPFIINWLDPVNPDNTAELLATLTFEIKADAVPGTYPLTLTFDCEGDIFNANWDTVYFAADEGSVTVEAGEVVEPDVPDEPDVPVVPDEPDVPAIPNEPEITDKPVIVLPDVTAPQGGTIDVAVSLKNNPGLQSAKVRVLFDNTVLELQSYTAGDFSASGYSWGKVENANANGGFVINWCDVISDPNTAELLATLTFVIKADAVPGIYALGLEYSCEDDFYTTDWGTVYFDSDDGSVKVLCDHEYDNACDVSCNKCGGVREVEPHPYEGKVTVAATCAIDGVMTYTCSVCGDSYTEAIPATGKHTYDNACDTTCNVCGGVREVEPHPYVGEVTVAATCVTDGLMTYTCSVCGDSYTEVIKGSGAHSYSAACDPICDACGFDRSDIQAPSYVEVQKPTVVVVGGVGRAGDTITVPVYLKKNPGLQSAKVKVRYNTSVLTLTEYKMGDFPANGYSWKYGEPMIINWCDAIGDPVTEELLATLTFRIWDNAKEGAYPITLEFSCEDDFYTFGFETVNFEKQESFIYVSSLQDHTYDHACDADCNVCGGVREVEPHPYVGEVTVAATCVTDGVMTYTCSVCGDSYTEVISANGSHTYDNACDAECNACGHVDATRDHTYSDDLDHDCDECGYARATPGDVNGDGRINNKDLGALQQYLNESNNSFVLAAGDVNGDGRINNKDLGLMQQYLNDWDVELK